MHHRSDADFLIGKRLYIKEQEGPNARHPNQSYGGKYIRRIWKNDDNDRFTDPYGQGYQQQTKVSIGQ